MGLTASYSREFFRSAMTEGGGDRGPSGHSRRSFPECIPVARPLRPGTFTFLLRHCTCPRIEPSRFRRVRPICTAVDRGWPVDASLFRGAFLFSTRGESGLPVCRDTVSVDLPRGVRGAADTMGAGRFLQNPRRRYGKACLRSWIRFHGVPARRPILHLRNLSGCGSVSVQYFSPHPSFGHGAGLDVPTSGYGWALALAPVLLRVGSLRTFGRLRVFCFLAASGIEVTAAVFPLQYSVYRPAVRRREIDRRSLHRERIAAYGLPTVRSGLHRDPISSAICRSGASQHVSILLWLRGHLLFSGGPSLRDLMARNRPAREVPGSELKLFRRLAGSALPFPGDSRICVGVPPVAPLRMRSAPPASGRGSLRRINAGTACMRGAGCFLGHCRSVL